MKNQSHDKQILRLLVILNQLNNKNAVRTADLAAEFGVSTRTVQRDLEWLGMAKFPIALGIQGYQFPPDYSLRKIVIGLEEKQLLEFLRRACEKAGPSYKRLANGFFEKVLVASGGRLASGVSESTGKARSSLNDPQLRRMLASMASPRKITNTLKQSAPPAPIQQYLDQLMKDVKRSARAFFAHYRPRPEEVLLRLVTRTWVQIRAHQRFFAVDPRIHSKDGMYQFDFSGSFRETAPALELSLSVGVEASEAEASSLSSANVRLFDAVAEALGFREREKQVSCNAVMIDGETYYGTVCEVQWFRRTAAKTVREHGYRGLAPSGSDAVRVYNHSARCLLLRLPSGKIALGPEATIEVTEPIENLEEIRACLTIEPLAPSVVKQSPETQPQRQPGGHRPT